MFSVSSKGMFVYKKMIHFNENISDVVEGAVEFLALLFSSLFSSFKNVSYVLAKIVQRKTTI